MVSIKNLFGKAKPTPTQEDLNTSLFTAAEEGDVAAINDAISNGAAVNARKHGLDKRCSALHIAASYGHANAVIALLDAGADANMKAYLSPYEQMTPLLAAAIKGRKDIVDILLKAHADIDAVDKDGHTALIHATGNASTPGHIATIKTLLEAGAAIDVWTENIGTAFWSAAFWNRMDAVKLLLAAGADITLKGEENTTPIEGAARHGHPEMAEYLQSVASGTIQHPSPEEVGLDMEKRNEALKKRGKPVGRHTQAESGREAQRRAALELGEGI